MSSLLGVQEVSVRTPAPPAPQQFLMHCTLMCNRYLKMKNNEVALTPCLDEPADHCDDVEFFAFFFNPSTSTLLKTAFDLYLNKIAKMRILALLAALAVGAHALLSDRSDQSIVASQNSNKPTLEAEQDRVVSLPGAVDLDFELFAGQVFT